MLWFVICTTSVYEDNGDLASPSPHCVVFSCLLYSYLIVVCVWFHCSFFQGVAFFFPGQCTLLSLRFLQYFYFLVSRSMSAFDVSLTNNRSIQ